MSFTKSKKINNTIKAATVKQPKRQPITLVANNGKERRIRSYILKNRIAYIPRSILSKLGFEAGFNGPEYWAYAITPDGSQVLIQGYRVQSEQGRNHSFTKDFTSVDQINDELYASE
jgi:hypothetical protein